MDLTDGTRCVAAAAAATIAAVGAVGAVAAAVAAASLATFAATFSVSAVVTDAQTVDSLFHQLMVWCDFTRKEVAGLY